MSTTQPTRVGRAARDLRGTRWWMASAVLGGLFATVGWFLTSVQGWALTPISSSTSATVVTALLGFVVGAALAPAAGLGWFYWQAPWNAAQEAILRVASLEADRIRLPVPRIRFEYDGHSKSVRLHVTNEGGEAEFSAPMTIDGALSTPLAYAVFAPWEHTAQVSTWLARGETRVLHVASLDTQAFPFAQWRLRVAAPGRGVSEVLAMHTSVVGSLPDTQAPRMLLHVSVVTSPQAASDVASRVVTLDPFGAAVLAE